MSVTAQQTGCMLCPRRCGKNRAYQPGFCGVNNKIKIARAMLHHWEEPCISGERGSGAIFFSGCALKCCYCQNYEISAGCYGKEVSQEKLKEIFLNLQNQGAHNINLVTAGHYIPWIAPVISAVKSDLKIPIVYNSSAYELPESLKVLSGLVDIYLPDLKYFSDERAIKLSQAPCYFKIATHAIRCMFEQVGPVEFDSNGILKKGVMIRHLLLPNSMSDAMHILDWIAETFPQNSIYVSLMSQYTPSYQSAAHPEINRKVSTYEYKKVLQHALKLNLQGYMQEKSAAQSSFTPSFSLQGID